MPEVLVQLVPDAPDLAVSLPLPEGGADVWWVKEELARQDPTGRARPESVCLCAVSARGLALEDGAPVGEGAELLVLDGEEAHAAEEARRWAAAGQAEEAQGWSPEGDWPPQHEQGEATQWEADATWSGEHWSGEPWDPGIAPSAEEGYEEASWQEHEWSGWAGEGERSEAGGVPGEEAAAHWPAMEHAQWQEQVAWDPEEAARQEEERQRWEAEEAARQAVEEAARREREAEEVADAERRAKARAERRAREEAARKEEAERKAREEAERKVREEAERKAKEEADRVAKEEAERKAKEAAERKAKELAERREREAQKAAEAAEAALHAGEQEAQRFLQRAEENERERAASRKPLTEPERKCLEKQRIAVIVHGSRGDLQPFLSLCLGLLECKPKPAIKVFTDEDHCDSLRQFGIECDPSTDFSTQKSLQTKKAVRAMTEGDLQICFEEARPEDEEEVDLERSGPPIDWIAEVHRGLDEFKATLLIYNDMVRAYARTYSMTRDIPAIRVLLQPHGIPSNDIVPMSVQRRMERDPDTPTLRLWIMVIQWQSEDVMADESAEVPIRETPESIYDMYFKCEDLPEPVLCAYSGALWPAPDDWPRRNVEITGAWKVSKQEQDRRAAKGTAFFNQGQHQKLQDFLRAGKRPVYLGWGSMMVHNAEYMTKLAVDALRVAGQRGIVLAGWAGLSVGCLPARGDEARELRDYCQKNVLFLKAAPHEWLFPQCACAVHHGGIGTAQASLGAGVPTVITPVFCDQFDIGEHVQKLQVGIVTDQLAKVSPEDVGKAIRACCEDGRYLANARRLAAMMEREDGVSETCDLLRRFIASDLLTGKWKRRHLEYKQSLREQRQANAFLGPQLFKTPQWTTDLGTRYPVLAQYWSSQQTLFQELERLAVEQRLWYVKAPSCLARIDKALGSPEAGRFLEFAMLEELELDGQRLLARRRKGVGPEEGWVSIAVPGKEIVKKITSAPRLWEVVNLYNIARNEVVRLGKKRPGRQPCARK